MEYYIILMENLLKNSMDFKFGIKYERTTKAIRNSGKVLNMKLIAINKNSSKLKMKRFKMPNAPY